MDITRVPTSFWSLPTTTGNYAYTFNGVDQKLTVPHLTGSETVVSSGGTSVPTVGAGEITFTAGTCWALLLSDGSFYPMTPSPDLLTIQDTSSNGNPATVNVGTGDAVTMAYSQKQDVYNRLLEYGGSKGVWFNGVDAYGDTGKSFDFQGADIEASFSILTDVIPSADFLINQGDASVVDFGFLLLNDTQIRVYVGTSFAVFNVPTISDEVKHTYTIAYDDSENTVRVTTEGLDQTLPLVPSLFSGLDNLALCARASDKANNVNGVVSFVYLKLDGIEQLNCLSANAHFDGTNNIIPDSSGEGNDIILTNTQFVWDNALDDGSETVDGQTITNVGDKFHSSNNFDGNIKQTDATLLTTPFWSAGGVSFDEKSYADFDSHINGTDNVWVKWNSIGGVCHVMEILTYDVTKVFTQAEYNQMLAWLGGAACGSGVVPFNFSFNFSDADNSANIAAIT
jgi:hypothetical protein